MKKRIVLMFALALCCGFSALAMAGSAAAADSKITEQQVTALLKTIDQEIVQQNNAGVLAHLAENVTIHLTMPGPKGPQTVTMNKAEYQSNLEQGAQSVSNYQYERKDTRIEISRDGRSARVTDKVYESVTLEGKTIHTVSRESTVFTLQSGQLLATSIDSEIIEIK